MSCLGQGSSRQGLHRRREDRPSSLFSPRVHERAGRRGWGTQEKSRGNGLYASQASRRKAACRDADTHLTKLLLQVGKRFPSARKGSHSLLCLQIGGRGREGAFCDPGPEGILGNPDPEVDIMTVAIDFESFQ